MRIVLIRHGKTKGNLDGRYIGKTDEPLCREGAEALKARKAAGAYPSCGRVIASPMKRCLETAALLYPKQEVSVYRDLRECDFGEFEGKNYTELSGNPGYQKWIDSGGTIPFPGGESSEAFCRRCSRAFVQALADCQEGEEPGFLVHGGTIMAIFAAYGIPKKNMYEYQVKNGCGYIAEWDQKSESLRILAEI